MTVVIRTYVNGVDGTSSTNRLEDAREALRWLNGYDHEGASVRVVVEAEDVDAYKLLEALKS